MRSKNSALVSALISAIMVAGQGIQAVTNDDVKFEKISKVEANGSVLLSDAKNPQEEAKAPVNNFEVAKGSQVEIKAPVNNFAVAKGPQVEVKAPVNNFEVAKGPQVEVKAPVNNFEVAKGPQVEVEAPINNFAVARGPQVKIGENFQANEGISNKNSEGLSNGTKAVIGTLVGVPCAGAASWGIYKVADLLIKSWKTNNQFLQAATSDFINSIKVEKGWGFFSSFSLDGWIKVTQGKSEYYICFLKINRGDSEWDFALLATNSRNDVVALNKYLKGSLYDSCTGVFKRESEVLFGEKGVKVLEGSDFVGKLVENNVDLDLNFANENIVRKIYKEYGGWQKYFLVTSDKYNDLAHKVLEIEEKGCYAKLESFAGSETEENWAFN